MIVDSLGRVGTPEEAKRIAEAYKQWVTSVRSWGYIVHVQRGETAARLLRPVGFAKASGK
jgi:hypothetical protein